MRDEHTVPRPGERIASRVIDGQAVIIVMDTRTVHTLNEVGTRIWQLMDGRSVSAIVEVLTDEFEVSADQAREDVHRFIEQLRELDAIELRRSA